MKEKIVDTYEWMNVFRELLEEGKEVPMTITGGSMTPFLVHGRDCALVRKSNGVFRRGDIVFYRRQSGQYVMHRIVKIDKQRNLYFAGDAQTTVEGPCSPVCVFGKVEEVRRKGKWIRKGDFWWDFFAGVWIMVLPWRRKIIKGRNFLRHSMI